MLLSVFLIVIVALSGVVWFSRNQINELQSKNNELQNQNGELTTQNSILQNQTNSLENLNNILKNQTITLQNQTAAIQNETNALQNQIDSLQNQNEALQNQTKDLQNQTTTLQNENSLLQGEVNMSLSNPDVEIINFWQSGGGSVVFTYTAWTFNVTIQNMKNNNISGLSLQVTRIAVNSTVSPLNPVTKTINYTTQIDSLAPYEIRTISGYLGGAGFVGDFNNAGAIWVITLTTPQTVDSKTYTGIFN